MATMDLERAKVLLKATVEMLDKCDQSPIVTYPMETTVFYDEADCDGHCLREDIKHLLEFSD